MKKISLICVVALAGLSLTACGSNSTKKASSSSKTTSSKVVKHHSKRDKHSSSSSVSSDNQQAANSSITQQSSASQQVQGSANQVQRDKDGRVINPDGTRGPIPSPYAEGTPEYNQWLASKNESIRIANNEPELQLGPEPRANNGQ